MKLICFACNKEFEKEDKEYRRQIKRGRDRFFCSRTCAAVINNEEHVRSAVHLNPDNRKDEFSPFRKFVSKAKYRDNKKNFVCDINVQYLKNIWIKQNGICPFTGWVLILPKDSNIGFETMVPNNASLDRIDNSKGYIEDNVRFIAYIANIARNIFTDEQLIDFCKAVFIKNK